MKKKQTNPKHLIIYLIVLIFIIIAVFSITLKKDRELNKVESLIKDTTISISKIITIPFRFIIDKIDDYKLLVNIRKKYQELLPEVSRIDSLKTENIELRRELES